jgi:hypothetical protein
MARLWTSERRHTRSCHNISHGSLAAAQTPWENSATSLAMFALAGMFAAGGISAGIIRGIAKGDTIVVWAGMKRILMIAPLGSLVLLIAAIERWSCWRDNRRYGPRLLRRSFPGLCHLRPYTDRF